MNTLPATFVGLLLLLAVAQEAVAQKVYRCGPGGREYSQTPCPAGREVDISDPRSADQRQAAKAVAQDQNKLADQLAAERRERERSTPVQGAAGIRRGGPPDAESVVAKPPTGKSNKKKPSKASKAPKSAKPAKPAKPVKG